MNKSTQPAFPVITPHQVYSEGMTLRDYFAAQALAGRNIDRYSGFSHVSIAKDCYSMADAMIAESKKPLQ